MMDNLWYNAGRRMVQFGIYILITNHVCAQAIGPDEYKIYSSVISSEISDTTKSIALLKNGIAGKEVSEFTQNMAFALKSKDEHAMQQMYSWTESEKGGRPTEIDTVLHKYILDFCLYPSVNFELSDKLRIPCKTIMLNRYPVRNGHTDADWDRFYQKYPGSGGIFSFSRVLFYNADWTTAIVYFWHRRYGLNGHGALAILKKVNDEWNIQYKTYLWWN